MSYLWEDVQFWLLSVLIIVVVSAALGFGMNTLSRNVCEKKAAVMERPARYGLLTGCFIQTTYGEWVPLNSYRVQREER